MEPYKSLRTIFNGALDHDDPAGRARYLTEACGPDSVLRGRVEALLHAHDDAGGFFSDPSKAPEYPETLQVFAAPLTEKPGDTIGRYKLLQQIGEGGCGVVYMAEQEEPVRRRVALKVIKLGMDTKLVIARFEAERQALALMDHPNIARVLDAGATDTGRPYFVMELVRGIRITDYCDQNNLPTEARLGLFNQVCQAIQHAHQKGIIHRDIKPSNILVTLHDGVPVVKVIDFGIARATTGQRLTDKTIFTAFEQFIGTPAYMSPEQAEMSGLDIDTRSDIYALGVLLYELLTGQTPFDSKELLSAGLDAMRRTIREQEPARPSTRLSTMLAADLTSVAKHRQSESVKLTHAIRGDLDWIVMKALEKDRTRRYETANGLAQDIQRHLNNEPVTARPASNLYRFRKLVRRNKVAFAAAGAVAAALLAGTIVSTWQAMRANAALADLRSSAPAFAAMARTLVAEEKFEEAIQKLDVAIKLRPDVVEYLVKKADLLQSQFRFVDAARGYRAALRLQPGLLRAETNAALSERLAAGMPGNADAFRKSLGELFDLMKKEARPSAELMPVAARLGEDKKLVLGHWIERLKEWPVLRRSTTAYPPNYQYILHQLADIFYRDGRYAEAEPLYREEAEGWAGLSLETDPIIAKACLGRVLADWAWAEQGSAAESAGRAREAEQILRDCLEVRVRDNGEAHWATADVRSRLGGATLALTVTDPGLSAEARVAKFAEIETQLLDSNEILKDSGAFSKYKRDSLIRLLHLYEAWKKSDKMAEWQKKVDEFDKSNTTPETGTVEPGP